MKLLLLALAFVAATCVTAFAQDLDQPSPRELGMNGRIITHVMIPHVLVYFINSGSDPIKDFRQMSFLLLSFLALAAHRFPCGVSSNDD